MEQELSGMFELSDTELGLVSGGAAVAASGPGLSNASVVASSTNGVTAGGGEGLNAATFANPGSGAAAAVFRDTRSRLCHSGWCGALEPSRQGPRFCLMGRSAATAAAARTNAARYMM